jgi:glutathione S-transferase
VAPLTLYVDAFWASPWTAVVFAALREKQLEFDTSIAMMHRGVGALASLREHSLTGTAPVVQHGALWIAESIAIVEYLEDAFAPPAFARMLPEPLGDRARARELMAWTRTGVDALRTERSTESIFYPPAERAPLSPAAQRGADRLVEVARRLGATPDRWLFGPFGAADVDLGFALMRLVANNDPVPPALADYARAVWARPSVAEFVAHARPPNPPAFY